MYAVGHYAKVETDTKIPSPVSDDDSGLAVLYRV
jgi:hypothetical protein